MKESISELLWEEVQEWNRGNDYDGDLEYAINHNFQDVALFLWCGSGASNVRFKRCPVSLKAFQKECIELNLEIDRFVCNKCNHHGIYSKGEYASVDWCASCGDTSEKLPQY